MSLEQAICERWATSYPLVARIPLERVFTGIAEGCVDFPYATLARVRVVKIERTNLRRLETVELRLSIWDDDLVRGQAIAGIVFERMSGARFSFDGGVVHDMRRANYVETQQPSGAWLLASDFHLYTSQP